MMRQKNEEKDEWRKGEAIKNEEIKKQKMH
jgi:hypothetical protein